MTLTAKPIPTPFNKSIRTTAITVTTKGINCEYPLFHKWTNTLGFANLYPTINKTAAKAAKGILFKIKPTIENSG